MLRRGLFLLGLLLCGMAQAALQTHVDVTAAPAWKGWSRPGRATELDIRLSTDAATRATLEIVAGRQTLRSELDLQPGRTVRLHLPVNATTGLTLAMRLPDAPVLRRALAVAQSESPLLGLALATNESMSLDGFHAVALAADDLPRQAAAYASVDALVVDTATLAALDPPQLGALLAHAARCGRIVVLNADARVRQLLEGAGGCGTDTLMLASSLAEAQTRLASSLAISLPTAMTPESLGDLARPAPTAWQRVTLMLAASFVALALALLFSASLPVLLGLPAIAAVAILGLLHAMSAPSQLRVWSEGNSGARLARFQAWQQWPGLVRERQRVAIPAQLAAAVQPCDPGQPLQFELDASRGQASFAEFETRLFRQVALCYAGSFPMARAITVENLADGAREVRNLGANAWPPGVLLTQGQAYALPALGPGARIGIPAAGGQHPADGLKRTALARAPIDGQAALWALDLGGVSGLPDDARGWLLVALPAP